jgi:hypothetical protein
MAENTPARKPKFYMDKTDQLTSLAINLRISVVDDFERALNVRDPAPGRQADDNELYIPFIDAFVFAPPVFVCR